MFENMNLDVMNEKEMESFIQGLTEIINLPDEAINESNWEQVEQAIRTGINPAEKKASIEEGARQMRLQGYTREAARDFIQNLDKELQTVVDDFKDLTTNPYKLKIIEAIFTMLGEILNETIDAFLGYDTTVYFELVHPNAKIPTYAHDTDAGADVYAPEDVIIAPGARGQKVDTGFKMAMTPDWYMAVCPRSGLSYKTTMRIANTPGTVDADYRDNVGILIDNLSDETIVIKAGDRIAQFVLHPVYRFKGVATEDVNQIGENRGGGFGSTGN